MGAREANITLADNLTIGEDRPLAYDVKQSDDTTAQTMTGWALTWELLDRRGGNVVLTKTTAGGSIVIGNGVGTNDRATVSIAAADTLALSFGAREYWCTLRRTDAGSAVELAFGTLPLLKGSL